MPVTDDQMQGNRKKILLVEDDEILRQTLVMMLADSPYQIDSGAHIELLDRLTNTSYDLVLIDLMIKPTHADAARQLPTNIHFKDINWRDTGLELISRVRRGEYESAGQGTRRDVPIIVTSARGNYTLKQQLLGNLKVTKHFEKPYEAKELCQMIEDLL